MTADAGLFTLFAFVLADSLGIPVPGESALLVAGALASEGRLPLAGVIAVASVAAIVGDSIVYWVGRSGGRRLLLRDGWQAERRRLALARADAFFGKYGVFAVFFAKFIPGVRGVAAFAAGASGMRWGPFVIVNAVACVTWTTLVVAAGFVAGVTVVLVALLVAVLASGLAWAVSRRRRAVAG